MKNIKIVIPFIILSFLSSLYAATSTVPSYEDRKKEELIDHQIKIKIDHHKNKLFGDCLITFNGFKSSKDINIYFKLLYGTIKSLYINKIAVSAYNYSNYFALSEKQSKQLDFKQLTVTVPVKDVSRDKFSIRVIYEDNLFYGTATNPEDNKPFSLGQITKHNAFSSHINYYPYIQHKGKTADIYISTNLKNSFAISSGELIKRYSENDFITFHYHTDHMSGIIPYPFAIGEYDRIEKLASNGKTKIHIIFHPEDRKYAEQKLPVIENIFKTYENIFGNYPFKTLSITEIKLKEGNIGLAGQSLIMLSQKIWFQAELDTVNTNLTNTPLLVLADEINHQWNAYKVNTPNYLAEGISRYVDSLYMESLGGLKVLKKQMAQTQASYFKIINKKGIKDSPINYPFVYPALYFIKGACALHMLRSMYGYDLFKEAMKYYFDKYSGKVTTLDDFRKSFENVVNENLEWFFDQWYKKPGWPILKTSWENKPENILKIDVEQIQGSNYFRLDKFPIKIFYSDDTSEIQHINIMAIKKQTIELKIESPIKSVEFDPDKWFLKQIKK